MQRQLSGTRTKRRHPRGASYVRTLAVCTTRRPVSVTWPCASSATRRIWPRTHFCRMLRSRKSVVSPWTRSRFRSSLRELHSSTAHLLSCTHNLLPSTSRPGWPLREILPEALQGSVGHDFQKSILGNNIKNELHN